MTMPGAQRSVGPVRLDVRDLEIRLGRSGPDVVSEVCFSVRAGEVLGLVGESGSGKTTVALALLGHARRGLTITSGEIRLDDTDLLRLSQAELRRVRGAKVSYVPQDPAAALNPTLRIGTQLKEALEVHAGAVEDPEARIMEVLSEASLQASPQMLRRYPHQLSGGQQQRVTLAMAFSCRPSLIVLDEPTTGLDVSTQRNVLDTIRSMCESYGVAAVYVSHDLAVVSDLVAQVAVMYAGRVIEIGRTTPLFGDPLHPYTRGLIAAVPSSERAEVLAGIEGQQPRPGQRGAGCSFSPRCTHARSDCRNEAPEPIMISGRAVRCLRVHEIRAVEPGRQLLLARPVDAGCASVLSVRSVSASYSGQLALSDVNLSLAPQSCLAVVGESGSGKTTLARCIVGLHSKWTGEISFDGAELPRGTRQRSKSVLRRVQYIFQNPYTSLNPRKTVGSIVAQPLEQLRKIPRRERTQRVVQVLEEVSLGTSVLSRYPDQLSGGERQRVAIARALVVEPDLLVCDEVTSALDVSVQAIIVELLRGIQRQRSLAMIFITHNLALVRSIAQSVVVLCQGSVVESGPVDQILEHPAHPYTIQLVEDVPKLAISPPALPVQPDLSRDDHALDL
jgi:peptide/nickel transport system ATP-binding protein